MLYIDLSGISKALSWESRNQAARPYDEDGLGIRDLLSLTAIMIEQAWRLISDEGFMEGKKLYKRQIIYRNTEKAAQLIYLGRNGCWQRGKSKMHNPEPL